MSEAAPEAVVPEVPTEAAPSPPAPEPAAPRTLEERLAKAEAAAARRKDQATARQRELDELKGKYQSVETEKGTLAQRIQRFEELQGRARMGDEEALVELAGISFDDWTRLKLEPETARRDLQGKGEQSALQKELEAIKAKLQEREEQETARAIEDEKRRFVAVAHEMRGESPDLEALDDDALLELGGRLAPEFYREHGRAPSFKELATLVGEAVRPYHERIFKAYSARQPAKPATPPKAPPLKGQGPATITAKETTTSAAEKKVETPEEVRERAIRKARELMNA